MSKLIIASFAAAMLADLIVPIPGPEKSMLWIIGRLIAMWMAFACLFWAFGLGS